MPIEYNNLLRLKKTRVCELFKYSSDTSFTTDKAINESGIILKCGYFIDRHNGKTVYYQTETKYLVRKPLNMD